MSKFLDRIEGDIDYDVEYLARRRKYYEDHKANIQAVARELKFAKDTPISASTSTDQITLNVSGSAVELKEIFRAFRKLGYEPSRRPGIKPESSFSAHFFHDNEDKPQFFVNFSSMICKRVKVGTKTVEQDIYEVICE